jgi:hypothetical protein
MIIRMCILAGCDYLKNLPGIGIKKAYNYVLKYKNTEDIIKALKNEISDLDENYHGNFVKAELTFLHQRVYDNVNKKLITLHPLSEEMKKKEETHFNFLGPILDDEIIKKVCNGIIDPETHEAFNKTQTFFFKSKESDLVNNNVKIGINLKNMNLYTNENKKRILNETSSQEKNSQEKKYYYKNIEKNNSYQNENNNDDDEEDEDEEENEKIEEIEKEKKIYNSKLLEKFKFKPNTDIIKKNNLKIFENNLMNNEINFKNFEKNKNNLKNNLSTLSVLNENEKFEKNNEILNEKTSFFIENEILDFTILNEKSSIIENDNEKSSFIENNELNENEKSLINENSMDEIMSPKKVKSKNQKINEKENPWNIIAKNLSEKPKSPLFLKGKHSPKVKEINKELENTNTNESKSKNDEKISKLFLNFSPKKSQESLEIFNESNSQNNYNSQQNENSQQNINSQQNEISQQNENSQNEKNNELTFENSIFNISTNQNEKLISKNSISKSLNFKDTENFLISAPSSSQNNENFHLFKPKTNIIEIIDEEDDIKLIPNEKMIKNSNFINTTSIQEKTKINDIKNRNNNSQGSQEKKLSIFERYAYKKTNAITKINSPKININSPQSISSCSSISESDDSQDSVSIIEKEKFTLNQVFPLKRKVSIEKEVIDLDDIDNGIFSQFEFKKKKY